MNRRQMMMLSGAAASPSLALAVQPAGPGAAQRASYKTLLKLGKPASTYKIPKTGAKKTKYLNSLTAALTLAPDQQQQAAAIFSDALSVRTSLRTSLKTARQNLNAAVKSGDSAGIEQAAAAIGTLRARLTSAGANAHAALFHMLSADQQARLNQFQS